MLFSIVVTLMVILITAFWAYQGFFGSMIMFLETVVACIVAFAFYEDINTLWVDSTGPGIGLPLALMLLFLAVLFILRYLTDRLIPNNVSMPMMLDRAGGAVCGLFTGEVLVGMALLSIQMLPIGSTLFGFERYTVDKGGQKSRSTTSRFSSPIDSLRASRRCCRRIGSEAKTPSARRNPIWCCRSIPAGQRRSPKRASFFHPTP